MATKWIDEEIILAYVYSKKFGMKISKKETDFDRAVRAFASIQNRDLNKAKSTLNQKLRNLVAWSVGDVTNDGGLSGPKNPIHRIIKSYSMTEMENIYNELLGRVEIDLAVDLFSTTSFTENEKHISAVKANEKHFSTVKAISYTNTLAKKVSDVIDNKIVAQETPNSDATVTYNHLELKDYLRDIRNSKYKVPVFQREFVWKLAQITEFLNALLKGFPFGNIVVWAEGNDALEERNEVVKSFRNKESMQNETYWLLDGQQRTSSVISVLTEHVMKWDTKKLIFSFENNCFKVYDRDDTNFISAADLLNDDVEMFKLREIYKLSDQQSERTIEKLRKRILGQKVGVTIIKNATLESAIDIFAAINTKGKTLSLFDIVNAKWHSKSIDYSLEQFCKKYRENNGLSCIDDVTLLKTIYICLNKDAIGQKSIMKLEITSDHIALMDRIALAQSHANDFLVNDMGFKPELMPSVNLFKFITYAFFKHNNIQLNQRQLSQLKKYVRYVCLENMYSSSTDTQLERNLKHVESILVGESVAHIDRMVTVDDVLKTKYSENSARYYFILNALFANARSLKNNSKIPVTASAKKNSSINIHHIIPKSLTFEGNKIKNLPYGDSLANLVPIREDENLQISNKLPIEYYEMFYAENGEIDNTLSDLLINPETLKSIDGNSTIELLNDFWQTRAAEIAETINKSFN